MFEKGTPVPTRKGTFHLGDTLKGKIYQHTRNGGTELEIYEGELIYHVDEARFLILDPKKQLSYTLNFAIQPEIIKKWNEN